MMSPKKNSCRTVSKRGFTLVEIAFVVVIIGLLTILALPLVVRARDNARAARFISDLRNAVQAFELYAIQTGYYPSDTAPGVRPPEMAEELERTLWDKPTPIGGSWDWSVDQGSYYAGVAVSGAVVPTSLLQAIDRRLDDGDLSSGMFQGSGGDVVYIIE